ncbi:MAG: ABC transporter permease [Lachnospiraceae bacterium]|nr:ABC transporter permease [Lachnospiraceae bacterium]MDD3795174.1 ABC transporter permease [Lachnospiraceae bacterium]
MIKKKNISDKTINVACACISIGAFLFLWYWGTAFTKLGMLIPGPVEVLETVTAGFFGKVGRHSILVHVGYSMIRVMIGFIVGSVFGIVLGLLMGWYRIAEAIFNPLFRIIRPIPPIAWIPISIIWFGLGENAKIFLIFLASFSNTTLNSMAGAKNVDREVVNAAKMLGANERQIFTTIVLPASVPSIFAGLQVAISSSWATVLAAEMVRSSEGLGWMIVAGMNNNDMLQILSGIVMIGVVGFILAIIMRKAEDILCRWNKSGN